MSYKSTIEFYGGVNHYRDKHYDEVKDYLFFSYTGDELLDKDHPKYISLFHQEHGSDDELKMKTILIGFAVQCPEYIDNMNAFLGNWEGSPAVIVKTSNPGTASKLGTEMKTNEKMDVWLGTCSERNNLLCYIAGQFFKVKDDFTSVFHLAMKVDLFQMTLDHHFLNKIGNN